MAPAALSGSFSLRGTWATSDLLDQLVQVLGQVVPSLGSALCLPWSLLPSEHEPQRITTWAVFTERIQDAISSLESIQNHPDVSLCSIMALIYAHKCCETIGECSHAQPGLAQWGRESPTPEI